MDERVDSRKKATPSWRCGFGWVSTLLRKLLRAWDELVMEDCECYLDDLYNDQFSFEYVAVEHSAVPHIIGHKGRVIRQLQEVCRVLSPFNTLGIACMRCLSLVLGHLVSWPSLRSKCWALANTRF